jgi:hypothetical protein
LAELSNPPVGSGGEIDDYVGDMTVVTCQLERGIRHSGGVRGIFTFLDEIEREAEGWRTDFGEVPCRRLTAFTLNASMLSPRSRATELPIERIPVHSRKVKEE